MGSGGKDAEGTPGFLPPKGENWALPAHSGGKPPQSIGTGWGKGDSVAVFSVLDTLSPTFPQNKDLWT